MVLISLMLSVILLGQDNHFIERISETEASYPRGNTPAYDEGNPNTIEDCIREYLLINNMDELHVVINNIEKKTLKAYIDTRKDTAEIYSIKYIEYMIKATFSFVSNGKIYVLTYEPIKSDKHGSTDNSTQFTHKNLYLYRRDDDGWKKASDLIREDVYIDKKLLRVFNSHTSFAYAIGDGWSVNKTSNGSVSITFSTMTWTPQTPHHSYNSILILVPNGNETYHVTYFEPENKQGKIVKNYRFEYSKMVKEGNDYKVVKKMVVENAEFPVLCGTHSIDYVETSDGLTINYSDDYWDGSANKPVKAGTLNFKITGTSVIYNGTIKLLNMK